MLRIVPGAHRFHEPGFFLGVLSAVPDLSRFRRSQLKKMVRKMELHVKKKKGQDRKKKRKGGSPGIQGTLSNRLFNLTTEISSFPFTKLAA
jgi:hypothetical protein